SHTVLPWHFVGLRDVIDIIIVAILIYELLRLVHGTRAVQMAVGLGLIGFLYELSSWLGLSTVQWVLRNAVLYLGFAVIVLFQHEIRAALTHLGASIRIPGAGRERGRNPFGQEWYDEVVLASTPLPPEPTRPLLPFQPDITF